MNYAYDALNRMIHKDVPPRSGLGSTHRRHVHYAYDVRDLVTRARKNEFNSLVSAASVRFVATSLDDFSIASGVAFHHQSKDRERKSLLSGLAFHKVLRTADGPSVGQLMPSELPKTYGPEASLARMYGCGSGSTRTCFLVIPII